MATQPKFPDTLRALSIAGPYAYLMATGEKYSEGRSWKTNFRGVVLLHVSTGREYGEPQSKDMISAIIGAAKLYNCTPKKRFINKTLNLLVSSSSAIVAEATQH